MLREKGFADQQVKIVDCLIEYAGKATRGGDLFAQKDVFSKGKRLFNAYFKEVQNVLLQHKPQVSNYVDQLFKGKLSLNEFPGTQ